MNEELKSRLKSFAWRLASMIVVTVLAFVIDNAVDLQIPAWGVVVLGLISGEITKYMNNNGLL
jgi:hypothetical protein